MTRVRRRVRVTGVVQGVGFRPFVARLAGELALTGAVGNDADGVWIEAEGPAAALDELVRRVQEQAPRLAAVDEVSVSVMAPVGGDGFVIAPSMESGGATSIPPDTAVCEACLAEMRDCTDRRFGYPFIACMHCGPRYTITESLPYDREHTTMAAFALCADCQLEYDDPGSRRFHAQPTACPACGPSLSMPVSEIVAALCSGLIVAIKGVGGYHLVCDARDVEAVASLRQRKQRGDKPFALMAASLATAAQVVDVDAPSRDALTSSARPIVLAPSLDDAVQVSVAPGNGYLGVMLPYAPVHHLLFDSGAPELLVMTSGNLSDEPICTTVEEAEERLAGLADVLVHHDRGIHVACDDSVLRARAGVMQPVRRSRGYAPLPITLPVQSPALVAVGGELKTTVCVARGTHAWLSQHIGDTANLETLGMLSRTVDTLTTLQRVQPEAIVSDLHPAYLSRRWAAEEATRRGIDHLGVQHHHAHLASLLVEHAWPTDEPVLGFTFDGTGYGGDGSIWGGELLLGTYAAVTRVGHLAAVPLPGGDAAIRRPLRAALSHTRAAGVAWDTTPALRDRAQPNELAVVGRMLETGTGCTPTTSAGRLFDAIAALLDVRSDVDYEGQAAMELEALAESVPSADASDWVPELRIEDDGMEGVVVLDPGPAVRRAAGWARSGRPVAEAAHAFHRGLARGVADAAGAVRERTGVTTVGLTGGVFSNGVLTAACRSTLESDGFRVLMHQRVPPNDGGLALGQVAVAAVGGAVHCVKES